MFLEWEKFVRKRLYEYIYFSVEEIIYNGKFVFWKEMMFCSGLYLYVDLVMVMLIFISVFLEEYKREDLVEKLYLNLKKDFYYLIEDYMFIFLLYKLFKFFGFKGVKNLYFFELIFDINGLLQVNNIILLDIWDISNNELIIIGEDNEYVFMSIYDFFIILLLVKEENIEYIVYLMNVEVIICDKKMMIDWYF